MKDRDGSHFTDGRCGLFLFCKGLAGHVKLYKIRILSAALLVFLAVGVIRVMYDLTRKPPETKEFFAMDTVFSLRAYGRDSGEALALCEQEVRRLEACFSVTLEGSDVERLNRTGEATVAQDTFVLIQSAIRLGEQTAGALDITLYPVLREWGFTTGAYQVPEQQRIGELLAHVRYAAIRCEVVEPETAATMAGGEADGAGAESYETYRVQLPEGAAIDLGAVAKGYTGDRLVELLRQQGVKSAILDLGGNVQTLGTKPDGSPWRVAVRNPLDASQQIGVLEINDKCVITSGAYERFFIGEDGRRYGHILDPADGYPVDNGLLSVTVVGDSGVRCDGLSTALFVMGTEKATEFWRNNRDFDMILVEENGRILLTDGLVDCYESNVGGGEVILR